MTKCQKLFGKLVEVVAALRSENGCPWDKEQTHSTLKSSLLEETYEVIEAIDAWEVSATSPTKLQEELGDLLMQVMLHAQVAQDEKFVINKESCKLKIEDVREMLVEYINILEEVPDAFDDIILDYYKDIFKKAGDIIE